MISAAQARQKLEDLTSAVALARAEVEEAREAVAESEATQADVSRSLKALAKVEDRQEQARAEVRVCERREAAARATAAAENARVGEAVRRISLAKRDAELIRWRAFLLATLEQATEFDARLRGLSGNLRELGAGQFPSRWASWPALLQSIDDQLKHAPERTEA